MPEQLPSAISTGTNSYDSIFALELDTKQRFDNILNNQQKPIEYPLPDFDKDFTPQGLSQDDLLNPDKTAGSIGEALFSPDLKVSSYATDRLRQMQAKLPVTKGIGVPDRFGYSKEMDKYLKGDWGYNPYLSIEDNEDFNYRYDYMSHTQAGRILRNVGTGLTRFVGSVALKLGQTLGYTGSMIWNGVEEIFNPKGNNFMADVADNSLSRWFEGLETDMKNSNLLSVFKPKGWEDMGFFQKMGNGAFWTDELADGAAFMGEMVASMYLLGGLGKIGALGRLGKTEINLTKALEKLGRVSKVSGKGLDFILKTATGAENLSGVGRWAFATASESAFEASGLYTAKKEALEADRREGKNNLTDDEIRKQAGDSAAASFKANMLILSASNAFENRFIFSPLFKKFRTKGQNPKSKYISVSESTENIDELAKASRKQYNYKTWVGKKLDWKNSNSRLRFYGSRGLSATAAEGFWEENAQLAVERLAGADNLTFTSFANQLARQTRGALTGSDPEAATNIGLGAFVGIGGTSIVSKVAGGNKRWQGERRKIEEDTQKAIAVYEQFRRGFLNYQDVYERDETGKPIMDTDGNLKVDPVKMTAVLEGTAKFVSKLNAADTVDDPLLRKHMQDNAMADYVVAAKMAGIYNRAIERFENLKNIDGESLKNLGFDPNTTVDAEYLKDSLNEFGKIYEQTRKSVVKKSKNDTVEDDENRKHYLYKAATGVYSSGKLLNEYQSKMMDRDFPSVFSPEAEGSSSEVQAYNSLLYQENGLEQFAAMTEENGDFYNDYIRAERNRIKSEKARILAALTLKEEENQLFSESKSPEFETIYEANRAYKGPIRLQSGLAVDDRGFLYSPQKYEGYSKGEVSMMLDQENDAQKKHAEYTNIRSQQQYLVNKFGNPLDGIKNYKTYKDFIEEIQKKDAIADSKTETKEESTETVVKSDNPVEPSPSINPVQTVNTNITKEQSIEAEKVITTLTNLLANARAVFILNNEDEIPDYNTILNYIEENEETHNEVITNVLLNFAKSSGDVLLDMVQKGTFRPDTIQVETFKETSNFLENLMAEGMEEGKVDTIIDYLNTVENAMKNFTVPEVELTNAEQNAIRVLNQKDYSNTAIAPYTNIIADPNRSNADKREALKELSDQMLDPNTAETVGNVLGRDGVVIDELGYEAPTELKIESTVSGKEEGSGVGGQHTSAQEAEPKKADIEKLEKEKQEALQPLIEEKERLEKEIAEIEKDTKGSLQESDRISSVKKEIANLRNENGEIPANKMGEFNKLSKLLRFLQLSPSLQIERAIQDFIDKNNLTDKQERYIRSLSKIRDSFSEIVQELQDLTSVEFVKSDLMDIVDSNNTSIEKIINDSQDEINETKNKASNIAAKELGIEIEKEYSADELDNFVQKHGSNQTKFIWNLIKNIAQKLGVKTRFSLEGKTTVPNGYAGHYAQGKIDNRATLLQTPDVAARVIVHELVHGVTNYIIDAVKKNRTDVLSLLTQKQINAAKKLSALLKQLQSDSNTKDFYGAKNEDEILAELTHDGFVEALKNKKLNFVEKILDYILDILGVSTNAYEEALGILKDMLENPIDYIDKGFVQSNSLYSQSNTKLDQLKQQLAEVNKKIDEVTKRFDAQIAQKQSELKALEEQSTSAKKADIERRRQERLSSIFQETEDSAFANKGEWSSKSPKNEIKGTTENILWGFDTKEKLIEAINAKYDAEIAALEQSLPTQEVKAALPTGQKLTQDETDLLKAIDIAEKGLAEGKDFEEIAKEGMTDTDTGNAGWLAHFNRYFNWKKSIWDKADRESVKKELLDKQAKAEQPTVSGKEEVSSVEGDKLIETVSLAEEVKKSEVADIEFKVGDKVVVNTKKDGESTIKEIRGDKALLEDGRQVKIENLISASIFVDPDQKYEETINALGNEELTSEQEAEVKLLSGTTQAETVAADTEGSNSGIEGPPPPPQLPPPAPTNTEEEFNESNNYIDRMVDESKLTGLFTFPQVMPAEVIMERNTAKVTNGAVQLKTQTEPLLLRQHNIIKQMGNRQNPINFWSEDQNGERLFKIRLEMAGDAKAAKYEKYVYQTGKGLINQKTGKPNAFPFIVAMLVDQQGNYVNFSDEGLPGIGKPFGFVYTVEDYFPNVLDISRRGAQLKTGEPLNGENGFLTDNPLQDMTDALKAGIEIIANINEVSSGKLSAYNVDNSGATWAKEPKMRTVRQMMEDGDLQEPLFQIESSGIVELLGINPDMTSNTETGGTQTQFIKVGQPYVFDSKSGVKIPLRGKLIKDLTINGKPLVQGALKSAIEELQSYKGKGKHQIKLEDEEPTIEQLEKFKSLFLFLRTLIYSKNTPIFLSEDGTTITMYDQRTENIPLMDTEVNYSHNLVGLVNPFSDEEISYQNFVEENFMSGALPAQLTENQKSFEKLNRRIIFTLEKSHKDILDSLGAKTPVKTVRVKATDMSKFVGKTYSRKGGRGSSTITVTSFKDGKITIKGPSGEVIRSSEDFMKDLGNLEEITLPTATEEVKDEMQKDISLSKEDIERLNEQAKNMTDEDVNNLDFGC